MADSHFSSANDTHISVFLSWYPLPEQDDLMSTFLYHIMINDITAHTTSSNFSTPLVLDKIYMISLYASACGHTVNSSVLITNISTYFEGKKGNLSGS